MSSDLQASGYEIFAAPDGRTSIDILNTKRDIDIVLLDLGLPDGNGLDLIEGMRTRTNAPIIIVSGRDSEVDRILGLERGADDYLVKATDMRVLMRELMARVKANVRRYKAAQPAPSYTLRGGSEKIRFGRWLLDSSKYQIFDEKGKSGNLTVKEFQLLEVLVRAAGRVLSREHLFALVRDDDDYAYDRAIDVQITRIRKKIGDSAQSPELIKTVRGIGYMFEGTVEDVLD
ncbi:MAG: response regulator transcription factor [Alphaproteobacteria bacterium]|nr:response regulator transcription factor [Alphaproteobacteria bacterium]